MRIGCRVRYRPLLNLSDFGLAMQIQKALRLGVCMSDPQSSIPVTITCPNCQHDLAKLIVSSRTIVTVTCLQCDYVWATELDGMSKDARTAAQVAILQRDQSDYDVPRPRGLPVS